MARACVLLIALAISQARAHVILETPTPFLFAADGHYNPILPDGSDFPCKAPSGGKLVAAGPPTVMPIGSEQNLAFSGQAVHGGGSCQIALTKDLQPTKESTWMVIHSIEGGCPARNQKGNLDGRRNGDLYKYKIPDEGIKPGYYVLSWTWQSRIGGLPEFYQNCAPIQVTKSKKCKGQANTYHRGATHRRLKFPDLFMANMGNLTGGCTTEEAQNLQMAIAYPDPGAFLDHPEGTASLFKQACDGNPRAKSGSLATGQPTPISDPVHEQALPTNNAAPEHTPQPQAAEEPVATTTITSSVTVTRFISLEGSTCTAAVMEFSIS